jgi:hypothetical protein
LRDVLQDPAPEEIHVAQKGHGIGVQLGVGSGALRRMRLEIPPN